MIAPARRITGKRLLDLAVAVPALLLTAPVVALAAAAIRLTSPGPVLFRQTRIGQGGRPFTMLKLRTMRVDAEDGAHREMNRRELRGEAVAAGLFKLEDDRRITPVGRVLRQLSLDEMPQLVNVIRGEMSLVGPRPSLPWEVALYTPEQRRREAVPPGITGLWQVSGRSRLPMPEMLALDIAYVQGRSLALDLWILLRTPRAVLVDRHTS